ncbi:hypothetical protein DA096_21950 [Vibrio rotiferianus]|nr:hypothetical protein DA095_24195 [Vibrio rotiferianus]TMX43215.1 hypothetical protein DA093_24150 [Vibrio rotiferianus]TMX59869.1 hypothetical protein DA096_21950 [Vibrio rotiferianus]
MYIHQRMLKVKKSLFRTLISRNKRLYRKAFEALCFSIKLVIDFKEWTNTKEEFIYWFSPIATGCADE